LIPNPMRRHANTTDPGIVKSVLVGYMILVLHLVLVAALGLLVLFFRGVVSYMVWIFLGGVAVIGFSAWHFFRRMKREGRALNDMLASGPFRNRAVEVSLLGGLANLRVGAPSQSADLMLPHNIASPETQLEDGESQRLRELAILARLLEKKAITQDDFDAATRRLFSRS